MAPTDIASTDRIEVPTQSPPGTSLRIPVLILCGIAILLGWLPRMHWGFWTDEAGSFWMACEGWRAAMGRTSQWAGQSVLYSIIESFFVSKSFWMEPLMRIPSVAATLIAAWQLKRLAELIFGEPSEFGWIALVPFVAAPDTLTFATSARPYALALAASLASFRYLLEWQQTGRKSAAAKYLIGSVLVPHLHFLFAFTFVIQAVYLFACGWFGRRVRLWLPLTAAMIVPLSLLPVLRNILTTAHNSTDFAHAARPEVIQLFELCFPPALLLAAGLGGLLLMVTARNLRWRFTPIRREFVVLIAAWLVLAPAGFFLVARFTPSSIFASRYLLFVLPAPVLTLAWLVSGLERKEWRLLVLVAIVAGTVLHPGNLFQIIHDSPSSWRGPLQFISEQSSGKAPVFVASGLANTYFVNWREIDPATDRLYAPLSAYPLSNRTIPLPYEFGEDVKDFIQKTPLPPDFFLLSASDSELAPWMLDFTRQLGFRADSRSFNDFVVIRFKRE